MSLLLILLIVLLLGGLPPVSGQWHGLGYGPSGVTLVLLVVLVVLLATGRL